MGHRRGTRGARGGGVYLAHGSCGVCCPDLPSRENLCSPSPAAVLSPEVHAEVIFSPYHSNPPLRSVGEKKPGPSCQIRDSLDNLFYGCSFPISLAEPFSELHFRLRLFLANPDLLPSLISQEWSYKLLCSFTLVS